MLCRLADGLTREQIAAGEGLSLRTVKRIVARLEEKLDAANPFVLGMKAAQLGMIPVRPADSPLSREGDALEEEDRLLDQGYPSCQARHLQITRAGEELSSDRPLAPRSKPLRRLTFPTREGDYQM